MTKATREGRRLRLELDEDIAYLVDPVAAARGRILTNLFLLAALGELSAAKAEAVFIEALGPANYARATGFLVDRFEDDLTDEEHLGEYRQTFGPAGPLEHDPELVLERLDDANRGLRFVARPAPARFEFDSDGLRQEEVEALALCAFYWQTVAGMEAVQAFLDEGEGLVGSVKAMALLRSRLVRSPSPISRNSASENPTQQGGSPSTDTPHGGAKLAAQPARTLAPVIEPPKKGRAFFRR